MYVFQSGLISINSATLNLAIWTRLPEGDIVSLLCRTRVYSLAATRGSFCFRIWRSFCRVLNIENTFGQLRNWTYESFYFFRNTKIIRFKIVLVDDLLGYLWIKYRRNCYRFPLNFIYSFTHHWNIIPWQGSPCLLK